MDLHFLFFELIYGRLIEGLGEELYTLTEEQLAIFAKTANFIDHFVEISERDDLDTVPQKLGYITEILPDVFSKGTPYGFQSAFGKPEGRIVNRKLMLNRDCSRTYGRFENPRLQDCGEFFFGCRNL